MLITGRDRFEEGLREREHRHHEERVLRYRDEYSRRAEARRTYEEHRIVEVPFLAGESLMIRHALAVAARYCLVPFCDDRIHWDALRSRIESIQGNGAVKAVLSKYGYMKDVSTSLLAQIAISETVPSFENVPLETVIEFRDSRAEELERFRDEMRRLTAEMEAEPWDEDMHRHVQDAIDLKVKPALRAVEDEINNCKDKFWSSATQQIAKVGPLPMIGAMYAGVPPHVAVALGGAVAALGVILETWAAKRKVRRNGFALLLDAKRLSSLRI
jgi:hypothetical protein